MAKEQTMSSTAEASDQAKEELADDLFPNFNTILSINDPTDLEIIKYLELIDQYTNIIETINSELKDGFIDLSRANYAGTSLNKPYGRDYWDEKVKAVTKV